jgi:hypothetical protein
MCLTITKCLNWRLDSARAILSDVVTEPYECKNTESEASVLAKAK